MTDLEPTTQPISNTEPTIDSRDVIARLEFLRDNISTASMDELDELKQLSKLADDAEDYVEDWEYGAALVHEGAFTEHITEMVKECYVPPETMTWGTWPWKHLDWQAVADDARKDYTKLDFGGETYFVR